MIGMLLLLAVPISGAEYAARRGRLMAQLPDGVVLLHARATAASSGEGSFKQDASFLYFTGLANQPSAILALDSARREAVLFVPPGTTVYGESAEAVGLASGEDSARAHGFSRVVPWEGFVPHVRSRLAEGIRKLYVDEARLKESPGMPGTMLPVAGDRLLFRRSVEAAFPGVEIGSAQAAIRTLRWAKSPAEVAILREVARSSAAALLAGIRRVGPGRSQRQVELSVVNACVEAGAVGPSFWPWAMSGPNAHGPKLDRSFFDYEHVNREMKSGELVRVDVGCAASFYEGDVGRTVPVSGRFTPDQQAAWDLLVRAYRAGLSAMKAGVGLDAVRERARSEVLGAQATLRTDAARRAAEQMLREPPRETWHIHGVGLDSGEAPTEVLEAGSVVAFEPEFSLGDDAYYLEDMILVTESGHEVLTSGLPYGATEIEGVMRPR